MPGRHKSQKLHAQKKQSKHSAVKPTKGERLDAMARKKDERAIRRKEKKAEVGGDEKSFAEQLAAIGLKIRDVIGDGNCLFRALGDQLDGDDRAHMRHRQDVARYISDHRSDFEPFIEDDVPFEQHVKNLATDGTYAGNDSIVAFARLHKLTVVIHQLGSPAWEVHGETPGTGSLSVRQLHISYHNGDHYASVRRLNDNLDCPANVRIETAQQPLPSTSQPLTENHCKTSPSSSTAVSTHFSTAAHDLTSEPVALSFSCDPSNLAFVDKVMACTKCTNRKLIVELCEDAGYFDIDQVCSNVLALMDAMSSPASSSVPSDGEAVAELTNSTNAAGAKPKVKQRRNTGKKQRKMEKKARAAMRHKLESGAVGPSRLTSSDEDDLMPHVITQNLQVLQI